MNKKTLCVECAFRLRLEDNPTVIVMSTSAPKLEASCYECEVRIGHSKQLNSLVGVYHERRHDESSWPHKTDSIEARFNLFMENEYNGDTLSCFIMAIQYQKYGEDTIRRGFNRLVNEEDIDIYDRKKLLNEFLEITNRQVPKTIKN